jgi:hypothetical protein
MDYKKFSIALGFVVAFLAGCVVHDVVRVAPPARAGVMGQRWEYACGTSVGDVRVFEKLANENGAMGWEMVGYMQRWRGPSPEVDACFKRPAAPPPSIGTKPE